MSPILIVPLAILIHASHSLAAAPYCVPGQQCFPSASDISAFNASISGRLFTPPPYASVCYNPTFNLGACQTLFDQETLGPFRLELPAGVMYTNWELDDQGKGCPQPTVKPTGPLNGTCTLGALAAYEVFASSTQDVSLAVKFAAKYNLRLRVKNTGHDYTGRSTAPGSFTIWTHHLDSSSFNPSFTPTGCNANPQQALIVGPANTVSDLYEAADRAGVTTFGGFTPTVGAAGGYITGGGTGPTTRIFGMGVDNVLQFQVVTADGSIKIANECTNEDLFWALRGGGGAFAIHTEVVVKAYPAFKGVNTVSGVITANSTVAWTALLREWLALHVKLDEAGFSGIAETFNPAIPFVMVQPFTSGTPVPPAESLAVFDSIKSIPGVIADISPASFSTWLEAYNGVVVPVITQGSLVGDSLVLADRVIPKSVMATDASREPFVQFLAGLETSAILQFVVGGAVSTANQSATSIHPAWRDALLHVNLPVFGTTPGVTASQNATVLAVAQAADKALFPAGATPVAYYNEDFAHEPNWQRVWWGSNYDRLLQIKKAVDPKGVFSCRRCVGSEIFGF